MEQYLNKIIQGDCLEILKTLPDKSIDLILQDPPYNTTACKWEWDIMTKIDELWYEWKRVIKDNGAIVMTASQPFTSKLVMSNLKMFKYEWVWEKSRVTNVLNAKHQPLRIKEDIIVFSKGKTKYNPQGISDCEKQTSTGVSKKGNQTDTTGKITQTENGKYIQTKTGYPTNIIRIKSEGSTVHPTQKPVALMEYLIKTYTNEGDTVFDGFAGSGTTAVACKNLNRNYICVELNEHYARVAQQRIDDLQPKLILTQKR